ncbi:hypothetical protein pb186bvf_018810 [Paramecium bursaria]
MDSQKAMTFSFQTCLGKKLQEHEKRSKSSSDYQTITTADSRNYQTIVHSDEVSSFVGCNKFQQSLNKILINQNTQSTQTDQQKQKIDVIQDQVSILQSQRDEIIQVVKQVKRENQMLQQQNKILEQENLTMRKKIEDTSFVIDWPEKEKFYQQTLQQQNWQIMKMTQELHQLMQDKDNGQFLNGFSQQEQEAIKNIIKQIQQIDNKQERSIMIKSMTEAQELRDEIIQLKKSHLDKMKELMERIKTLQYQCEVVIEPELLSTQESLSLVTNVLGKSLKSNEMMGIIKSSQRLCLIVEELNQKIRYKFDSNSSRAYSMSKVDLNSTNKKFSQRK